MKTATHGKSKSKEKKSQHQESERDHFFENILDIDIGRPKTAYNIFMKEQSLKEEFKGKSIGMLGKVISEKYKALSNKEKDRLKKLAENDVERYENNMRLVKKYVVDPDKLNENQTPYMLFKDVFVYEYMNEKGMEYDEASKAAQDTWKSFDNQEKEMWNKRFKEEQEMLRDLRKFKSGKVTAYMKYVSNEIELNGKTQKEARDTWKNLSEKQRNKYQALADKENAGKERLRDLYEIASGKKPKRPMGAYSIFLSEMAASGKIEKSHFMTEGSKMWKELPEEEKEHYYKQHKLLSLKYQIKKTYYNKFNKDKKVGKVSAYNIFSRERSEYYKEKKKTFEKGEFFSIISDEWSKTGDLERKKYQDMADELNKEKGTDDRSQILSKKPKLPLNAYTRFLKEHLPKIKEKKENKGKPITELFRKVSEIWRSLPQDEVAKLKREYQSEKEKYEEELDEYYETLKDHDINLGRRKSQSKVSQVIQSQISKKSQSKSKMKSKPKKEESPEKTSVKQTDKDKNKEKEKDKDKYKKNEDTKKKK